MRKKHAPQARKALRPVIPFGTNMGWSIYPKSGSPIPAESDGSNHTKSCKMAFVNEATQPGMTVSYVGPPSSYSSQP